MLMPSIFGEDMFDDFMRDFPFFDENAGNKIEKKLYGRHAKNMMKTDIKELESGYELEMDLLGFTKDEITAELKDGYLTIHATSNQNKDEKDEDGKYIRRERYSGSCNRSFYVGDAITEEDIKANFENGTLKMTIPKKEAKAVPEKKFISIEG